jgi:hypothetical protein
MPQKIIIEPDPNRTLGVFSNLGYTLQASIGDLVDNSISAGKANNIHICMYVVTGVKPHKLRLVVYDDGEGIPQKELEESMRMGSSDSSYDRQGGLTKQLSQFGIGMKSASLQHSYILAVCSKSKEDSNPNMYILNPELMSQDKKWVYEKLDLDEIRDKREEYKNDLMRYCNSELGQEIFQNSTMGSWTLISWEKLKLNADGQKRIDDDPVAYIRKETNKLEEWLGLHFHRFIAGTHGTKKTYIYVNARRVTPMDPFCLDEKMTIPLERDLSIEIPNAQPVKLNLYILPHKKDFSSAEKWEEAKLGTDKGSNQRQGFFVYKNNRLIDNGWYGSREADEHTKLARASIDIDAGHNDYFTFEPSKQKVSINQSIKDQLKTLKQITRWVSESRKVYGNSSKNKKLNKTEKAVEAMSSRVKEVVDVRRIDPTSAEIKNSFGKMVIDDRWTEALSQPGVFQTGNSIPDDGEWFYRIKIDDNFSYKIIVNEDHPYFKTAYPNGLQKFTTKNSTTAFLLSISQAYLQYLSADNKHLFEIISKIVTRTLAEYAKSSDTK